MTSRVKECPHLKENGIGVAQNSYMPSLLLAIPERSRMSYAAKVIRYEKVNGEKALCWRDCPYPDGCVYDKVKGRD